MEVMQLVLDLDLPTLIRLTPGELEVALPAMHIFTREALGEKELAEWLSMPDQEKPTWFNWERYITARQFGLKNAELLSAHLSLAFQL